MLPIMLPAENIINKKPTWVIPTPKRSVIYNAKKGNNIKPPNLSMKVARTNTLNGLGNSLLKRLIFECINYSFYSVIGGLAFRKAISTKFNN